MGEVRTRSRWERVPAKYETSAAIYAGMKANHLPVRPHRAPMSPNATLTLAADLPAYFARAYPWGRYQYQDNGLIREYLSSN